MATKEFSDNSTDDDNFNYLLASGILPFFASTDTGAKHPGSQKGKHPNTPREFDEALKRLNRNYFGPNPKYGRPKYSIFISPRPSA